MRKKLFTFLLVLAASVGMLNAAVDGKLLGAFTVDGSGTQVYFSQGNLQYTKSTGKWKIMDHQYDVVETLSQNVGTDYASQDVITLFGWGTSGWDNTAADATSVHYQPYSTCNTNHSTANNNYQYGPSNANVVGSSTAASAESWSKEVSSTHPYENYDWGVFNSGDLGAGWRTLTTQEWGYLFNTRTPGNSVNGVSNARYTEATINTDGTAVNGIILFPDDATLTTVSGVTWGTINGTSAWGTTCTTAGWEALEAAGCVFLPAAGDRNGTSVDGVGSDGIYWSSSANSATYAYFLDFSSGYVNSQSYDSRVHGFSVRLVSETAPSGGSTQATGLQVIEMQVPPSWENDQQLVIVPDLPGFVVFTLEEAGTWAAPEGYAHLIYTSKNNEGVRVTHFNNGVWGQEYVAGITRATVFGWASSGHRIFYTTDGPAPALPSWVLDGDEWDEDTKTLTVNSNPGAGAYASQSEIENLIISDAVTSIGQAAFAGCSNISYVTCGNNIQTIGVGAFTQCGFTYIELPASVTTIGNSAFYSCSNLSSVAIGNNVASIGNHAFDACGSLTEITIPASVTTIGVDAFYNCTGMTDVYCYPNAADLTWNEDGCDDFKASKATNCHVIASQLSAYQTKFTGVVNVTFVGDLPDPTPAAGLQVTELQIPASWEGDNTLVTISDLPGFVAVSSEEAEIWDAAPEGDVILIYAGKNDEGVTAIEFNNRVLNGFGPFGGFSRADLFDWASGYKIFYTSGGSTPAVDPAVQNVIDLINAIPNPVAYNDECKDAIDAARAAYDALTDAQNDLVENYGVLLDAETAYALLTPNPSGECGAQGDNLLWELNTSTGVLTITGSGAMYDWSYDTDLPWYDNRLQITSVVLPSDITSLGTKAFRGCQNLASINMTENYPAGLTAINQEAFCHTALTSVIIPKSVVTIGQDAFYQSQSITDVYCYADPNNLTWTDFWCDDFASAKSTQCHVKDCYLDVYNSKWNTGTTSTDVNVTFVGDLPGDCGGSTPSYIDADFAIDFRTDPYTVVGGGSLPTGVEVEGSMNTGDAQHGYRLPVITIPVTAGNYLVKMGTCKYSNQDGAIKNEDGTVTYATLATNTGVCYHQNPAANYVAAIVTIPSDQIIKVYGAEYTPFFSIEKMAAVPAFTDFEINFRTDPYDMISGAKPAGTVIAGSYNDADHGYHNVEATVPMQAGTYRLTLGACGYGNGAGNVMSETNVELAAFNQKLENNNKCYHQDPANNIVSMIFTVDIDQTITIDCGEYTPYMKLEKLQDNTYYINFENAEGAIGTVPGEVAIAAGESWTIPANLTLYKEGYTFVGWSDGVNTYAPGDEFFPSTHGTLQAVYTANSVSIADASTINVKWYFGESNGAPSVTWNGTTGYLLAKGEVDGQLIDLKLDIDATASGAKFDNAGRGDKWAQVNANTVFTFPSKEGAVVNVETYSGNETYDLGNGTLTCNTNDYYSYLEIVYPAPTTAVVIGDPNDADQVTAFLNTYDGQTVPDLTIDRPVLNNMYNTLCLPFHMDADQIANSSLNGVEIYEFVDADVTNDELYLYTSEQKHEIVAGRPYLVKFSAASQLDELNFIDVEINNADLDNQAVTIKGVTFKGTFQPIVLGAQTELDFNGGHLFLMANNTLMWPNTNNPLKPFRAYFTVNVDAGQSAGMPVRRGMPAHIGGPAQIPTGVDQITNDQSPITNKVMINGALYIIRGDKMYDAQGQVVK